MLKHKMSLVFPCCAFGDPFYAFKYQKHFMLKRVKLCLHLELLRSISYDIVDFGEYQN